MKAAKSLAAIGNILAFSIQVLVKPVFTILRFQNLANERLRFLNPVLCVPVAVKRSSAMATLSSRSAILTLNLARSPRPTSSVNGRGSCLR